MIIKKYIFKKADLQEVSPIFIKKVFKILPLRQIATWRRIFETRACWIVVATGNIHMKTGQKQK